MIDSTAVAHALPVQRSSGAPVRIAVLDDHPAVRAGLHAQLSSAPGLTYVGGAADDHDLWPLLHRTRPDVVVLDLHHPGRDGLTLTAMITRRIEAPRVVLHAAVPSDTVALGAALAGAVAIIGKAAPVPELMATLREAARRETPVAVSITARRNVLTDLEPDDRALIAMRLAGTPIAGMAEVFGTTTTMVLRHLQTLLATLAGRGSPVGLPIATLG